MRTNIITLLLACSILIVSCNEDETRPFDINDYLGLYEGTFECRPGYDETGVYIGTQNIELALGHEPNTMVFKYPDYPSEENGWVVSIVENELIIKEQVLENQYKYVGTMEVVSESELNLNIEMENIVDIEDPVQKCTMKLVKK